MEKKLETSYNEYIIYSETSYCSCVCFALNLCTVSMFITKFLNGILLKNNRFMLILHLTITQWAYVTQNHAINKNTHFLCIFDHCTMII